MEARLGGKIMRTWRQPTAQLRGHGLGQQQRCSGWRKQGILK